MTLHREREREREREDERERNIINLPNIYMISGK